MKRRGILCVCLAMLMAVQLCLVHVPAFAATDSFVPLEEPFTMGNDRDFGFEGTDDLIWGKSAGCAKSTDQFHSGNTSMKIAAESDNPTVWNTMGNAMLPDWTVPVGRTFKAKVWVYIESWGADGRPQDAGKQPWIEFAGERSPALPEDVQTGEWFQIETGYHTMTDADTSAVIVLGGGPAGSVVYFDDVQMMEKEVGIWTPYDLSQSVGANLDFERKTDDDYADNWNYWGAGGDTPEIRLTEQAHGGQYAAIADKTDIYSVITLAGDNVPKAGDQARFSAWIDFNNSTMNWWDVAAVLKFDIGQGFDDTATRLMLLTETFPKNGYAQATTDVFTIPEAFTGKIQIGFVGNADSPYYIDDIQLSVFSSDTVSVQPVVFQNADESAVIGSFEEAGGTVNLTTTVTNTTDDDFALSVLAGLYQGDKLLAASVSGLDSAKANGITTYANSFDVSGLSDFTDCSIRVFYWDGTGKMTPVKGTEQFPSKQPDEP